MEYYDSECVKRYECSSDRREIEDRIDRLYANFEDRIPYFLVGVTKNGERKYIAVFSSEEKLCMFVRGCRCKTSPHDFRKRSPLGEFADWDIVRFYAPELPFDPLCEE